MTRAFVFLALACVIAVLVWQVRAAAPEPPLPEPGGWRWTDAEHVECIEYVVGVGDTLWSIAGRYYPDRRTDEVVWLIREVNELQGPQGPVLQPGQVVLIPDPLKYGVGRR